MKVLLINPSFDTKIHYGVLHKLIKPRLPLSIGFLMSFLENKGIEVKLFDEQVENINKLKSIILNNAGKECFPIENTTNCRVKNV